MLMPFFSLHKYYFSTNLLFVWTSQMQMADVDISCGDNNNNEEESNGCGKGETGTRKEFEKHAT